MSSRVPILSTKVIVPRRRDEILSRQRLLDLMLELADLRLIIVAAPAGYGKTSLLVDFANFSKLPPCWYALDPLDQDLQRFAAHLVTSISTRFPKFGQSSMAAVQSLQQDASSQDSLENLAALIANDIYENVHEHFLIILDDYHLVEESRQVTQFINQLIQSVDENCHFVVASRTLLNLPDMPLLVARNQVGGLSFEELAFQPDEIQSLWLNNFHLGLPDGEAVELAQQTEGWITGLLLSRQIAGSPFTDRMRTARVAGVGLYEYLAQQVLDRQSVPVQTFLMQSSLLEEFDADLCQEVLEPALNSPQNWSELIEAILRANLFIQPIGEDHIYLRYHHLFRDFLQSQMTKRFPAESERIQLALAETWAKRYEWERSYRIFQRLGKVDDQAALVERAGPDLIARGRLSTLADWLENLPEGYRQRPQLISLRGAVYVVRGRSEDGVVLFDQAIHAFEAGCDEYNLARSLTRRATAHRLLGHFQHSLEDMQRALAYTEKLTGSDSQTLRSDALAGVGAAYFHMGNLANALNWLDQAYRAFEQIGDGESMAKTAMQIGLVNRALGNYADSERAYQRALSYYQSSGNLIWQANVLNNLGVLQHLRGSLEEAANSFEKAIQYARIGGYARLEAYALASIGDLYRDLDSMDEAQEAYRQSRPIALRVIDRYLIFYIDLVEAVLAYKVGQRGRSERLLEVAWRAAEQSGSLLQTNQVKYIQAGIALTEQEFQKTLDLLAQAQAYFEKEGHRAENLRCCLMLAVTERALGNRASALTYLERVYRASAEPGNTQTVVVIGRELRAFLETMSTEPDTELFASALLRLVENYDHQLPTLRRQLRRQSQTIPLGPPKLVIHTLGKIQVKVNGRVVSPSDWLVQTARDLFLLILSHPDGMPKEEIGEIMWPESSPAELKLRFKNTIYRMRRAVGKDVILFDDDNGIYTFDRSLDYEEDSETFLREIKSAEAASDLERKAYHLQAAMRCYKGAYLPELEDEWVIARRNQLARNYNEVLLRLASVEMERRHFDEALTCVEALLKQDPCYEEAHRLGMLIHAATGNRAGVMRQFELCSEALKKEYHALPSLQTRQLYRSLIQ